MQTSILCSICKSGRLVTDVESAEVACESCGLVASDSSIENPGRRMTIESDKDGSNNNNNNNNYNYNYNYQRVGLSNSLAFHDMGLSTIIGSQNKDSTGQVLSTYMNYSMRRLRTWDARSRSNTPGHGNLIQAFNELRRLKDKVGLTDAVVEMAAYIYRKAEEKQMIRGRSMSAILAAAIYIACREVGAPKSLREMTDISQVKSKAISHCYRLLALELDIKIPLIEPSAYIARVANKAGISEKSKRFALTMMKEITKNEISAGKNPIALAATVLYISCRASKENQTQMNIASAAGITDISIRNRLKDLRTKHCFNAMMQGMLF